MEKVLLITTTEIETELVLQVFSDYLHGDRTPQIKKKNYLYFGHIGNAKVYMVRSQMGSGGPGASLLTTSDAINVLKPDAVIMVGIAFGMHPDKQKMGDILVSTEIAPYEAQKIEDNNVNYNGGRIPTFINFYKKFEEAHLTWKGVAVHYGPMLSGEKLIKSKDFRDKLLRYAPEAIGGEMEGAGLYAAASTAKVDCIIVKAVSDFADGIQSDDYRKQAAQNAALYTLHTIRKGFRQKEFKRLGIAFIILLLCCFILLTAWTGISIFSKGSIHNLQQEIQDMDSKVNGIIYIDGSKARMNGSEVYYDPSDRNVRIAMDTWADGRLIDRFFYKNGMPVARDIYVYNNAKDMVIRKERYILNSDQKPLLSDKFLNNGILVKKEQYIYKDGLLAGTVDLYDDIRSPLPPFGILYE